MAFSISSSEDKTSLLHHRVFAVVPAAGQGQRMINEIPKQFLQVCGAPLVSHCLKALSEHTWIEKVVLVVHDLERTKEVLGPLNLPKVILVKGLNSRHRSIYAGLKAVEGDPPDLVIVHDGARPIIPKDILTQVAIKALETGASGVVRPLVSTVIKPDQFGKLETTLKRSIYRNSEMPQAFLYQPFLQAYKKCSIEDLDQGTECLELVLKYQAIRAHLIDGTADLWKVTHPEDIRMAEVFLSKHVIRVSVLCLPHSSLKDRELSSQNFPMGHDELLVCEKVKEESVSLDKFVEMLEKMKLFNHKVRSKSFSDDASKECRTLDINKIGLPTICLDVISKINLMASDIINSSVEAFVTSSVDLIQKDCGGFIISMNCVTSVAEGEVILNVLQKSLEIIKPMSLVVMLSKKDTSIPDEPFLSLRKSISKLFQWDTAVVVIVCRHDSEQQMMKELSQDQDHSDRQWNRQFRLLLRECLKLPVSKALHGQIMFI